MKKKDIGAVLKTSPWIILGATAILIVVVLSFAIQNTRRERRFMSQMLSTKGAALIRAVEAGARTGMRGMMWGGTQVQQLLEETAQLPDVLYMAVIGSEGTILAHSDVARIGQPFREEGQVIHLGPDFEENWEVVRQKDGRRVFEVHRHFRPVPAGWRSRGRTTGSMMPLPGRQGTDDWFNPQTSNRQLIVIGLDLSPLEESIAGDIRNTVILSVVLLLLGFAGFVSLFWMHSYRTARRSLQDTSAFADEVVAHMPVGLIATDRQGRIAFFNGAAGKISGITPSSALGLFPDQILPSQLCELKSVLDQGITIREKEMECQFDRSSIPLSVSAARIVNETGQLVGHMLILRDLAEVRRLQDEIRRQEKLAALGGLAAGVAHEIRNPLSSIKGLATYFTDKFAPDSEDRNLARVMTQEVDRVNRVISELLEFARPTDLKCRPHDINTLLRHCLHLIQQDAAGKQIEIRQQLSEDLCRVLIDPDRFSQCALNLFLNAIEAMPSGGRLSVMSNQAGERWVRVNITDTGRGIAADHLDKIFNPYFTTKSKGTGLGLAIVHKIVEAHSGRIQVESTPAKGTSFTLHFPCHGAEKESADDNSNHSRGG